MVLIEVPDLIAKQYEDLARLSGQERNTLIREALVEHLEDLEDIEVVRERLRTPGSTRSLAEVEKNLGLAD